VQKIGTTEDAERRLNQGSRMLGNLKSQKKKRSSEVKSGERDASRNPERVRGVFPKKIATGHEGPDIIGRTQGKRAWSIAESQKSCRRSKTTQGHAKFTIRDKNKAVDEYAITLKAYRKLWNKARSGPGRVNSVKKRVR